MLAVVRRTLLVSLCLTVATATTTLASLPRRDGSGRLSLASTLVAAQGQTVRKLLIVADGIEPLQLNPPQCPPVRSVAGCYDPYARASSKFLPILTKLGCGRTRPAGTPFVPCSNGLAWIPYSYAGIGDGLPLPYTGAQTGQPLDRSASSMERLVEFARARPEVGDAPIVIVGHSLGGAIATYWGATDLSVSVLTFDAPVNRIWSSDASVSHVYCNASVGLFTSAQREACHLLFFIPAAESAALADLREPATVQRMGQASQLNFANTKDAFIPSWFAVASMPALGAVLKSATCRSVTDPIFNHSCIIAEAATEAAAFITSGASPPLTPVQQTIELTITAESDGTPVDGTVTAIRLGQVVAQTPTSGGSATLHIPWSDVLLEFMYSGGTVSQGVLPGAMTNLPVTFSITAPPRTAD